MAKPKPFYMTLLGKRWQLRYVPRLGKAGKGDDGDCQPPETPRREIRVRLGQAPQDELETYIHEMMHACNWILDEGHVRQTCADMARALWRLGYRKSDAPEDAA